MIRTIPIPRAHERAQRDRPVEPLVRAPRRAPLPDVGQVRVLRGPQRRRRLRLVAALQVPDPRPDAERFLAGVLARDIRACAPGNAQYTAWCDDRGFVVEDGVVLRPAADEFLLTVGRAEPRLLRGPRRPSDQVPIEEISRRLSASSPSRVRARATCSRRSSRAWRRSRSSALTTGTIAGSPVTISRTGYSGDLGFEIWIRSADALKVWDALWDVGRGLRRPAVRAGRAGHAPDRGRAAAPRRRLRVEPLRLDGRGPLVARSSSAGAGWSATWPTDDRGVHRPPRHRARARRQDLALAADRAHRRLGRLRSDLRRGRAHPAQGPHADPWRDVRLRRRRHARSATRPASCTRRCSSATSPSPGSGRRSPRPGRRVRLEIDVNHRYEYVAARTARCRSTTRPGRRPDMPTDERPASRRRRRRRRSAARAADRTYDAIVVGGGHNGLVNGAYLAKAGLKTLILERRPLVGGAAITEELHPGFWFTTFSYALSLLRPDIIHDLELTKHGFMPLLMSSTFAPMENGDYLWLGQDHDENLKEIARHSRHDADAYDAVRRTTSRWSARRSSRCSTRRRRTSSATTPRSCSRWQRSASGSGRWTSGPPQHRPAADRQRRRLPRRLLRLGHRQGLPRLVGIIGTKVGPRSQGSGLVLLYHIDRRARRRVRGVGLPQGGNGGFTQVLARAARSFGAEIVLESPVDRRHHQGRPGDRRGARRWHRVPRHDRGQRAGPAADVPRARQPARAAVGSRRGHPALPVPGHVVEGQLRARRAAEVPGPRRSGRPCSAGSRTSGRRWTTSSAPSTTRSTAGTASGRISTARSSRRSTRTWRPPGKHVMSSFVAVHAVQAARERLGHRAAEPGRHGPGDARVVLPGLRRPDPASRGRHAARHRADGRAERGQHLRRRVPCAADVLLPAGARLEPVPHPDRRLLPVRLGHAPGRLRDGRPGQARGAADPQGPGADSPELDAARDRHRAGALGSPGSGAASPILDESESKPAWCRCGAARSQYVARRAGASGPHGSVADDGEQRPGVGPGVQGECGLGCGERIRTSDLRVMSPTSCRCSTPRR